MEASKTHTAQVSGHQAPQSEQGPSLKGDGLTRLGTKKKRIRCEVVSDKMTKSRVGALVRLVKHPVVGKYIKQTTRYMFHDESNQTRCGDEVLIEECRPMSARKSFMLVSVVRSSKTPASEH